MVALEMPILPSLSVAGEQDSKTKSNDRSRRQEQVLILSLSPGGQPWKADVRSTVRNTATDERKTVPTRGSTSESASSRMPPRPPKAPAQAAREAGSDRRRPENVQAGKQLFFSKKPRDVDCTPATVEECRRNLEGSFLGGQITMVSVLVCVFGCATQCSDRKGGKLVLAFAGRVFVREFSGTTTQNLDCRGASAHTASILNISSVGEVCGADDSRKAHALSHVVAHQCFFGGLAQNAWRSHAFREFL